MPAMTLALVVAGVVLAGPAYADPDDTGHRVFTIRSEEITEASSLVVSMTHPGLAYTANDSGDAATIYVLDTSTGAVVGHTSIEAIEPVDIEGMAGGSDGSLVVADIGDNDATRSSVAIYRIVQPSTGDDRVAAETVQLTYADGPRDAESVLYDAASGRVFVVSKQAVGASIYATPARVFDRQRAVLQPLTAAPAGATDATFLAGGHLAVVRTYVGVAIYSYPSLRLLRSVSLPPQPQGESVAAPSGGRVLWVGSEGFHSVVLAVRLPRLPPKPTTPAPASPSARSPETAAQPSSEAAEAGGDWGTWGALWSFLGVGLAAGLIGAYLINGRGRLKR